MSDFKQQTNCRGCGQRLLWLKHEITLKPAPIEAEPSDNGNILIDTAAGTYRIMKGQPLPGVFPALHRNHFAGCSAANRFRPEQIASVSK